MTKTENHTTWKQPTLTTYLNVTGAEIEVTFLELYLVPDKYHEEMIKLSINKPQSFTLFPYYKEEKRIKSPFFSLISLFSAAQKDKLHREFTLETWNNRKKDYTWRNHHKENTFLLYPFFISFSHTFFFCFLLRARFMVSWDFGSRLVERLDMIYVRVLVWFRDKRKCPTLFPWHKCNNDDS